MDSRETHVLLQNTKTGRVWACPAGAVDAWLENPLWKKAPKGAEPSTDQPAAVAPTAPAPTPTPKER